MTSETWKDLVIAILSVNRYSLDKTYAMAESLERQGIFDPQKLADWAPKEIGVRLRGGGYDRGEFMTELFAKRLSSLGEFVTRTGIRETEKVLQSGDKRKINQLLNSVYGVGPKVIENFIILRTEP